MISPDSMAKPSAVGKVPRPSHGVFHQVSCSWGGGAALGGAHGAWVSAAAMPLPSASPELLVPGVVWLPQAVSASARQPARQRAIHLFRFIVFFSSFMVSRS